MEYMSAREAAEAGSSAERQRTGQGESTGFRSATVEPFAGRTGAAKSICTFNCGKVRKSLSIIVRGDVYCAKKSIKKNSLPEPLRT